MAGVLLDTNVISELTKPQPTANVIRFLEETPDLWLTSITLYELRFGLALMPAGKRRDSIRIVVDGILAVYRERILPIDQREAERAAELRAKAQQQGQHVTLADALIAGVAAIHGLTLATRNIKDFAALLTDVINPWEEELRA